MKAHIIESNFAGVRFTAAVCFGRYVKSSITRERVFDCEECVASFETTSATQSRAQAQAYIDAMPKTTRKRRFSEGDAESQEAARNERDYQ